MNKSEKSSKAAESCKSRSCGIESKSVADTGVPKNSRELQDIPNVDRFPKF